MFSAELRLFSLAVEQLNTAAGEDATYGLLQIAVTSEGLLGLAPYKLHI